MCSSDLAGTKFSLRIGEDEYFSAVNRVRNYADLAKYLGLGVSIAALIQLLFQLMQNKLSGWSVVLFLAGGAVRASASAIALWLGLRPFRAAIRHEVRDRRGWKRRGLVKGLKASKIPLLFWICAAGALWTSMWVWTEHNRRVAVLSGGQRGYAKVIFSGEKSGRNSHCQLDFSFQIGRAHV